MEISKLILFGFIGIIIQFIEQSYCIKLAADEAKFYCNFESGDCGWTSDPPGAFSVKQADRQTYIRDHTFNVDRKGHLVEFERPVRISSASYLSPDLNFTSGNKCLRMWTRYYFQTTTFSKPTLKFSLLDDENVERTIFTKSLTQNPPDKGRYELIETTITGKSSKWFRIKMTLDWQAQNTGFMFIDDTVIYYNRCEQIPEPKCFNPKQFACEKSNTCLEEEFRCNGHADCANNRNDDKSDEQNCPADQKRDIIIIGVCVGVGVPLIIITIVLVIVFCRWEKKRKEASKRLKEKERESNFNSLDRKRLSNRYRQNSNNTLLNTSQASGSPSRGPSMAASQGSLIDDQDYRYSTLNGKRTSSTSTPPVATIV